jgi:hypothetical protein
MPLELCNVHQHNSIELSSGYLLRNQVPGEGEKTVEKREYRSHSQHWNSKSSLRGDRDQKTQSSPVATPTLAPTYGHFPIVLPPLMVISSASIASYITMSIRALYEVILCYYNEKLSWTLKKKRGLFSTILEAESTNSRPLALLRDPLTVSHHGRWQHNGGSTYKRERSRGETGGQSKGKSQCYFLFVYFGEV